MPPDGEPPAAEELRGLPPARQDGAALRASVRALRTAGAVLTGVLDDDPTGSQAMHGVDVVTVPDETAYAAALSRPVAACFALTNTRSVAEVQAAALTTEAARSLLAAARGRGRMQLVSRSDSTLRGHLLAEVTALQELCREQRGRGYDAVLLVPAFLEAGRLTAGDIHWARGGNGQHVPVGQTEFARDRAFGYSSSNLKDFIAEKSGGTISRGDIASISLADIRVGGPDRVAELLAELPHGRWVVVNAAAYADLEAVACGVLLAEGAGQSFLFRTGPSFVRALTGTEPAAPLRSGQLWPGERPRGNGLIVVGSHVGLTSRQLAVLRDQGGITPVELSVPAVLRRQPGVVAETARQVTAALSESDVVLYTSRAVADSTGRANTGKAASLTVAREVSAAVARTVRKAVAARPAWVLAKGGITAHDVALHGLGIRRAEVAGQLFPGMISVLWPADAIAEAIGIPYVVFPGNTGDDTTLAQAVDILRGVSGEPLARHDAT